MKKLMITFILGLMPMMAPAEAQACQVCMAVSAASSSIVTAIQQATAQITGELEKQMGLERKIEESNIAWQTQRDIQYKAADIGRAYTKAPNICNTMNIGRQLGTADQEARSNAAAGAAAAMKRNLGTKNVQTYLSGNYQKHKAFAAMGGADVRADGLFAPVGADGKATLTYTPQQVEAAKFYSDLVVNPLPTPALDPELEKTPQGKAFVTMQLAEQARLSMADYSLSSIRSRYEPNPGMGTRICQSWNLLYSKYNESAASNALPTCDLQTDASMQEVMNFMVNFRMSPEWSRMITASSSESVTREQAVMDAFKIWMDYKNYEQLSRMEGLMAGGLAAAGDGMRPMLSAQRSAAASATARRSASGK